MQSSDYRIVFVDLDGTLIDKSINNTFDFIKEYYKYCGKSYEYNIRKKITKIVRIPNARIARIAEITILFYGLKYSDLMNFAREYWIDIIKKHIRKDVVKTIEGLKRNKQCKIVLLTACTEIPAKVLSMEFGFDYCICTEFMKVKGRVIGVKYDTYLQGKVLATLQNFSHEILRRSLYITDDEWEYKTMRKIFMDVLLV